MAVNSGHQLRLIRHAPILAESGRCYGISDWPADPAATAQAADRLATQLPPGLVMSVSPLQRCQQLAQSLQERRPDLRFKDDARLIELDFGAWEGLPWSAIARSEFDLWLSDFAHAQPGGRGESVASLMERVGRAWIDWQHSQADAGWITHAGVIRAARLLSRGVHLPATAADWPAEDIPFGEVLVMP